MKKLLKFLQKRWHCDINKKVDELSDLLIISGLKNNNSKNIPISIKNTNTEHSKYKDNNFYFLLINEIFKNITNQYNDNYDYFRFGDDKIKNPQIEGIELNIDQYRAALNTLSSYLSGLEYLYVLLQNKQSKYLLIMLITYRILGYEKCKLPLSDYEYFNGYKEYEQFKNSFDYIETLFPGQKDYRLYLHDFLYNNSRIKIYCTTKSIYDSINVKQYEYITNNEVIKINPDDICLDCGACFGDTALFFASKLNDNGHVFSFEFIPSNIKIFKKNIEMNTNLKNKITLIPNPLDEFNNRKLYCIDCGPASKVVSEPINNSDTVLTINIDTFFEKYGLAEINFIKMDIEGAELPALKGAINVLKKYKPKLAISIYHSIDDFVNIPAYLHSLNLGYKFYLKHGTIHLDETVLFAII